MASVENESIDLTYLIITIVILALVIAAVVSGKDTILGLFDNKISTRSIRY